MYKNNKSALKGFLHKCPEEKKQKFASSNVVLLVSVGQPYHEDEKLKTTVNFMNKHFKECCIMVNDSLQKYTIALSENIGLSEAYDRSLTEGLLWVERNQKYLQLLRIPCQIFHWDAWLNKKEYRIHRDRIDELHNRDNLFKEKMDLSIESFLNRNSALVEKHGRQKVYEFCLKYLLEETCVIMDMWKSMKYNFILYPGKILDILECVHYILKQFFALVTFKV